MKTFSISKAIRRYSIGVLLSLTPSVVYPAAPSQLPDIEVSAPTPISQPTPRATLSPQTQSGTSRGRTQNIAPRVKTPLLSRRAAQQNDATATQELTALERRRRAQAYAQMYQGKIAQPRTTPLDALAQKIYKLHDEKDSLVQVRVTHNDTLRTIVRSTILAPRTADSTLVVIRALNKLLSECQAKKNPYAPKAWTLRADLILSALPVHLAAFFPQCDYQVVHPLTENPSLSLEEWKCLKTVLQRTAPVYLLKPEDIAECKRTYMAAGEPQKYSEYWEKPQIGNLWLKTYTVHTLKDGKPNELIYKRKSIVVEDRLRPLPPVGTTHYCTNVRKEGSTVTSVVYAQQTVELKLLRKDVWLKNPYIYLCPPPEHAPCAHRFTVKTHDGKTRQFTINTTDADNTARTSWTSPEYSPFNAVFDALCRFTTANMGAEPCTWTELMRQKQEMVDDEQFQYTPQERRRLAQRIQVASYMAFLTALVLVPQTPKGVPGKWQGSEEDLELLSNLGKQNWEQADLNDLKQYFEVGRTIKTRSALKERLSALSQPAQISGPDGLLQRLGLELDIPSIEPQDVGDLFSKLDCLGTA